MLRIQFNDTKPDVFGHLCLSEAKLSHLGTHRPMQIQLSRAPHEDRARIEHFIQRIFAESYQASIQVNYPILMAVYAQHHTLLSALGMRDAGRETLFLEQYLDAPLTDIASMVYGQRIERYQIAEVGNLASDGGGAMKFLVLACTSYLLQAGYTHLVFTGTDFLYRYFERLGLEPQIIAHADPARLQGGLSQWGSYYDTEPKVILGNLAAAHAKLCHQFGAHFETLLDDYESRLHFLRECLV